MPKIRIDFELAGHILSSYRVFSLNTESFPFQMIYYIYICLSLSLFEKVRKLVLYILGGGGTTCICRVLANCHLVFLARLVPEIDAFTQTDGRKTISRLGLLILIENIYAYACIRGTHIHLD